MNLFRLSHTTACLTVCFFVLVSDAHAEIAVSVTPDLITEKLNDELQSRMEQIYVNSNDGLLRVNGWISPDFDVTGVMPIESAHSARGLVSFKGTVSFSSLEVQFGVLRRRVSGRLGLSGSIEISADENSLTIGNICWNPSVQCLTSNGPILNHLLRKRSIQRSVLRNATKRASHTLASYSGNINNKYLEFRDRLAEFLRSTTLSEELHFRSSKTQATIEFVPRNVQSNSSRATLLVCGPESEATADSSRIICAVRNVAGVLDITLSATEAGVNNLYRAAVGASRDGAFYYSENVVANKKSRIPLSESLPFSFSDDDGKALARVQFEIEEIGNKAGGKMAFTIKEEFDEDEERALEFKMDFPKALRSQFPERSFFRKLKEDKVLVGKIPNVSDVSYLVESARRLADGDTTDQTATWNELSTFVDSRRLELKDVEYDDELKKITVFFGSSSLRK